MSKSDVINRTRLRLMGGFALFGADGQPVGVTSRRCRGLLAYLYLGVDHAISRERLCGLLWSDRGETQARASLRQCLLELKDTLSLAGLDILDVGRERIALHADLIASDVSDLDVAMAGDDADALVAALGAAGRGRLLEDLELGGLFQDWLDQERARLEQSIASGVEARLEQLETAGHWQKVRAVAEAFLQRDPLDEAVTAAAIRADAATGATASAHRRFQTLKAALAREFGAGPGVVLRNALAAIGAATSASAAPSPDRSDGEAGAGGRSRPRSDRFSADHHERPTIAVLQFGHPSGGEEQAYFSEGMAEELIAGLARSRLLAVTARQSSLTYDPKGADARRICADLGVEYIVQGHVRRLGNVVRVSVELVSGLEDRTVWSARYDRPLDDLFAVQDEITAAIIGTLEPALLGHEETHSLQGGTRNPRHWDLFIRGRWHFWRSRFGEGPEAVDYLRQAMALEPNHVPTLSLVALSYLAPVWAGMAKDPAGSIGKAHGLALKAVSLDGSDAFAHYTLGTVLSLMGRIDHAMAEQRRALELNPYLASSAGELGRLFVFDGRLDEAITYSDRAIAASPNDPHVFLWYRNKAIACFIAERFSEAAGHAADACARGPHHFFLYYLMAACHSAAGDLAQARIALSEGRRLLPRYSLETLKIGHPFTHQEHLERFVDALKGAGWEAL
jgi:TolB-like protein/DNA-binding SARP family transcriptional activator/Tfp pilus assembly protein PilF